MTEYDYSPGALEAHLAKQAKVAQWAAHSSAHQQLYTFPFSHTPSETARLGSQGQCMTRDRGYRAAGYTPNQPQSAHHGNNIHTGSQPPASTQSIYRHAVSAPRPNHDYNGYPVPTSSPQGQLSAASLQPSNIPNSYSSRVFKPQKEQQYDGMCYSSLTGLFHPVDEYDTRRRFVPPLKPDGSVDPEGWGVYGCVPGAGTPTLMGSGGVPTPTTNENRERERERREKGKGRKGVFVKKKL